MDRRIFTISALAALLLTTTTLPSLAKDGADDGKDDGGDDSNDDGGDDSGSGGDDGNGDGGGKDDGGGDDGGGSGSGSGGSGSSGSDNGDSEHDQAKRAVDASEALPLQEMMSRFRQYGDYTVIDVRLAITRDKLLYVFKFIDPAGNVRRARFDAKTGVLIS